MLAFLIACALTLTLARPPPRPLQVTRTSGVIPDQSLALFQCTQCGHEEMSWNDRGKVNEPAKCGNPACQVRSMGGRVAPQGFREAAAPLQGLMLCPARLRRALHNTSSFPLGTNQLVPCVPPHPSNLLPCPSPPTACRPSSRCRWCSTAACSWTSS